MSEQIKSEVISRRKALSLLGLGTALSLAVPSTVLTVSKAEAQVPPPQPPQLPPLLPGAQPVTPPGAQTGTERRQQRRTGRTERRQQRRTGRTERRQKRRTGTTTPGTTTPAPK
jgi:hypothetical protein